MLKISVKISFSLISFLFLFSCICPESQSIINFSEVNIPEYQKYIENDKSLSDNEKSIRLLRIETFKEVANGLR